ncbi:NUDIX domain-containing protein, partial [Virgibacillus halodenitrificans]|nr:NUDIX domain-containing protein [Virgibacillus halodenitrificans]MYL61546.1 NUDIX domain-containing protein [Virgibacillus halodenitrificans]
MKIFGERNYDLNYWKRTGAYAVIQNHQQQFLCVEDLDGNLFLVGGGVEADEAPENALLRESIEETGHKIQIVETIGKAE